MRTADFLGEQHFRVHLERSRTARRILVTCIYSFLCLIALFSFELEVRGQEKLAEQANAIDPEASEAAADLERLFEDINDFALRLDPLAAHLTQPAMVRMLAGIENAVGEAVEIERVQWRIETKTGQNKKDLRKILVLVVDAVAWEEAAATGLVDVLEAYSGFAGKIERNEAIPDRWPATRLSIRLSRDADEAMAETAEKLTAAPAPAAKEGV